MKTNKMSLGTLFIRTKDHKNISKHGLGLGTFIGKTLLERNFAKISFNNSSIAGAEVKIKWTNGQI